ncbi:ureidoglycolate lyase [Limnoraphis robusta]|uniref:Ureidoglycolate hydrolase n=1 Tax=Limnoraphis robusta CS-951 TaxID=1637645 RepID=A0A0F5Y9B3_9CYAN|nr:ureidoglycolate lyase [Limnoraphis robusta]KKD35526.1 Ureidoglycolate hydrolase [Limnoraphis robusta CS-951]KMW69859.1 Ureidoglycolate hydrolase [Limnoraphis robusta CS-951]
MRESITVQQLTAEWITPEAFQPYGQVISASTEGKTYDETDAQLNLKNGIPRFYIMRLNKRGREFNKITRHIKCTQCLGSLEGKEWLMAVAPPSDSNEPDLEQLKAFRIPGNCFIKLEVGTWHAGPYFEQDRIDFYNLELSNTNIVDHFSYDFIKSKNLQFEIVI